MDLFSRLDQSVPDTGALGHLRDIDVGTICTHIIADIHNVLVEPQGKPCVRIEVAKFLEAFTSCELTITIVGWSIGFANKLLPVGIVRVHQIQKALVGGLNSEL